MLRLSESQKLALRVLTKYPEFGTFLEVFKNTQKDVVDISYDITSATGTNISADGEIVGRKLANKILEEIIVELQLLGRDKYTKDVSYE